MAARGRLMFDLPPGDMLSVRAPASVIARRLPPDTAIASDNAPSLCVVSGPSQVSRRAPCGSSKGSGIAAGSAHTSHAFHSPMMAPVVAPFTKLVAGVRLAPPRIPFVSTLTGGFITDAQACDPSYWGRHLLETVRFSDAVSTLALRPPSVLLEVGPRSTLATLARLQLKDQTRHVAIATLGDDEQRERESLLGALGQAWTRGIAIDTRAFHARHQRRRVPLPTYPFERKRFWIDAASPAAASIPAKPPTNGAVHLAAPKEPMVSELIASRAIRLSTELRQVFESASGVEIAETDTDRAFVELGLDSLFLTQVALAVQKKMGVKVTFRRGLVEELTTIPGCWPSTWTHHCLPENAVPGGSCPGPAR